VGTRGGGEATRGHVSTHRGERDTRRENCLAWSFFRHPCTIPMTASAASSTTTLTRVKTTLPHYTYAWGFVASVLAQAFEARRRLRWHARRRGCTVCGRAVVEAEAGLYPRAWSVSGHLGGDRNTLHPAGVQNGQEKRGTGVYRRCFGSPSAPHEYPGTLARTDMCAGESASGAAYEERRQRRTGTPLMVACAQ
jgi:hypothetical protein